MKVSRRDLLIGSAGVTAGFLFTPVPWKLLGDVSIWTQNWPWIPRPVHGPVETKLSACTLCANGCGVRVRVAGNCPVGIAGGRCHPLTKGALCPLGFAAHQLNWHPRRLREVRHRGRAASWAEAQTAFEKACGEGPITIIDGRPGRATSSVLEAFAGKRNGNYQIERSAEGQALAPYATWSGVPVDALGYDLENTRTIVSFGAPLLDGWGTPGWFTHLWADRAAGNANPKLRLIQIEPSLSRTAARAWQWIPLREGSDEALAAGLARVLLEEHLVELSGPIPKMPLEEVAAQTGLTTEAIRALARTVVENRPVVVIAADGNPAIAALNVLLGSIAAPGGIVRKSASLRSKVSPPPVIGLPRVVLIDSTVPWEHVPRTDAEVFRFAAWDGGGNNADWLLPGPGFLEELTDVPTPTTSGVQTYAIAVNLAVPPAEVKSAAEFLLKIDSALPPVENVIRSRCEELFRARKGTVYGEHPVAVEQIDSAKNLEEQLRKGAIWMDDSPRPGRFKCELKTWPTERAIVHAENWAASWVPPVLPPLAAKLYQESNLREAPAGRKA
jgi:anaerobic selenocysteine-containing dehydrogenase